MDRASVYGTDAESSELPDTKELTDLTNAARSACAAPKPKNRGKSPDSDPNLQRIIDAWPDLPKPVKAGIMAMVKAACPDRSRNASGKEE